MKPSNLSLFSLEMATFLGAGLSVPESLSILADRFKAGSEKNFVNSLQNAVLAGESLSSALESTASAPGQILIALVRSAEQSGDVQRAFARYSDYSSRVQAARRQIVTALIYPGLLLIIGSLVIAFFLLYILPRFALVYADLERALPWASQVVFSWGKWVSTHQKTVLAFTGCLAAGLLALVLSASLRKELMELFFSIPFFKPRRRDFEFGRFYFTLGILMESGLPLLQAIELSKEVLGSSQLKNHQILSIAIQEGKPLSTALEEAKLSTDLAARLVRSGEKSGSLAGMLKQCASVHEADTWRFVERFTKSLEPISTIVLGLIIGGLVVLMYLPIFELGQIVE